MNSGNQWAEASPWGFPEGSSPQAGPSRTAGLYQFRSSSILPPPTPSVPSPYFSSSFQAFHDVHQGHPHYGRDGFGSQSAAHLLPQFGDGKVVVPTLQHSQPAPLLAASTTASSSRPRTRKPRMAAPLDQDWEQHKPLIQELYMVQKLSLPQTIRTMRDQHKFSAT